MLGGAAPEPDDTMASPLLPATPTAVHSIDSDAVFAAVDASMRTTVSSLPRGTTVGLDSVRAALTDLANRSLMDPNLVTSTILSLDAAASTQETGRDALARMASESKSLLASVVTAHNSDLQQTESRVRGLESNLMRSLNERDIATHATSAAHVHISMLSQKHTEEKDALTAERDALQLTLHTSDVHEDEEANQAAMRMHAVWERLDPLVSSKEKQVERERKLIKAHLSMLEQANAISDASDDPELSLSSIIGANAEQDTIEKAITSVSKSIKHLDQCIASVMSQEFSLPMSTTVKAEYSLQSSSDDWKQQINKVYGSAASREIGLRFVTAVYQQMLQTPRQLYLLIPCWKRILSCYTATTKPDDYQIPSRFKLERNGEGGQPEWLDLGRVNCDEGPHKYSTAFSNVFSAQSELLYGMLRGVHTSCADEAMAGSSHGRYESDSVVFRAVAGEGLALLQFFAVKHRQITYAVVAELEQEIANSYTILAKTENRVKGLRAWRALAAKGMKLKLKIRYTSLIWRACQTIKVMSPLECGPIVQKYLCPPPSKYAEDSLSLVFQIASDCESALTGYDALMGAPRNSGPTIRAHRIDTAFRGGNARTNRRPARGQPARGGNRQSDSSNIVCSDSRCTNKVPTKALPKGFQSGDVHSLKCFDCWSKAKKPRPRTAMVTRDAQPQRRDRARDGQFKGNCYNCGQAGHRSADCTKARSGGGAKSAPKDRNAPAWMSRRTSTPGRQARAMRVSVSHATGANAIPVTTQAEREDRDGYLQHTRLYMMRLVRPDEQLVETLADNVLAPWRDSRALLQCPHPPSSCTSVRCHRAQAAMHDQVMLCTLLLDTGASHSIFSSSIEGYLHNKVPSKARITGFNAAASPVNAGAHGLLNVYYIQSKHSTLAGVDEYYSPKGQFMRVKVDTMNSMVDSLLSYSDLHQSGWSLRIVNTKDSKECTIEKVNEETGERSTIPLTYDSTRRGFVAYVCVGRSAALVQKRGRATERALQQISYEKGRTATLADLGYGHNAGKPPYAIEGSELIRAATAIENILPGSVHVSTAVNGEQLYGAAATLTRAPLTEERAGKGPNLTFTPETVGADHTALEAVDEHDHDVDAIDLQYLLHTSEHAAENYCYMAETAVHPYEKGRRARTRDEPIIRTARMQTEGPLGFAQLSGARTLAEHTEDAEPGSTPLNPMVLSSSSSERQPSFEEDWKSDEEDDVPDLGAEADVEVSPGRRSRAAPRTPARRRLSEDMPARTRRGRPPGLAAGDTPAHEALLHGARMTRADREALQQVVKHEDDRDEITRTLAHSPDFANKIRRRPKPSLARAGSAAAAHVSTADQAAIEAAMFDSPERPTLSESMDISRRRRNAIPAGTDPVDLISKTTRQHRRDTRMDARAETDLISELADVEPHNTDSGTGSGTFRRKGMSPRRKDVHAFTSDDRHLFSGSASPLMDTLTAADDHPAALTQESDVLLNQDLSYEVRTIDAAHHTVRDDCMATTATGPVEVVGAGSVMSDRVKIQFPVKDRGTVTVAEVLPPVPGGILRVPDRLIPRKGQVTASMEGSREIHAPKAAVPSASKQSACEQATKALTRSAAKRNTRARPAHAHLPNAELRARAKAVGRTLAKGETTLAHDCSAERRGRQDAHPNLARAHSRATRANTRKSTSAGTQTSTIGTKIPQPRSTHKEYSAKHPHPDNFSSSATRGGSTEFRANYAQSDPDLDEDDIVAMPITRHATRQQRQSPLPSRTRPLDSRVQHAQRGARYDQEPSWVPPATAANAAAIAGAARRPTMPSRSGAAASRQPRESLPGDEPTGTDLDEFIEDMDCPGITGTKRNLNPREQRQTTAHLHRRFGHIGHTGDASGCSLCQMMGGSFNRRGHSRSKVPADPELPGYRWALDVVYMSTPAISGELYACVMRDCCTGFYAVMYSKTKSFGQQIVNTIMSMRTKPHFQGFPYPMFTELRSDHDGSWFLEANTQEALDEMGVTCVWGSPGTTDDHRAHAFAEAAVRFITHTTKMILLQSRLPTSFWKWAMESAVQIRNLFPLRKYAKNVYSGDAIRPLEQLSRSRVSRSDCNQLLSALCPVGSLNLVHQAQLNSTDMGTPTARWGVCIGNMGKVAIFFCPFAGARSARFYSRNWMGIELPSGLGYHAALNITPTDDEVAPPGVTIPPCDRDLKLKNIIVIPNLNALTAAQRRVWSPVVSLKTGPLHDGKTPSIIMINDEGVVFAHDSEGNITRTKQVLTVAQRAAPDTNIINHLHNSGIDVPRSLDPHRTFDPIVLMTDPIALIGQTFWMYYEHHGYWLATVRLYDPGAKLWTATFRDGTFMDLHMRELEMLMVDRPNDPSTSAKDITTGMGRDIAERAAEGPDLTSPLPARLIDELRDDLGEHALKSEDGNQLPWSRCTVAAIQAALQNPDRLMREGATCEQPAQERTSPPHITPSRRKQARPARLLAEPVHLDLPVPLTVQFEESAPGSGKAKVRYYDDEGPSPGSPVRFHGVDTGGVRQRKRGPGHTPGQTGRTRGLNTSGRRATEADASKRHKSTPADGGVYPAIDDDGLPWADTIFNWSGNGLPPPAPSNEQWPERSTPFFEVNFEEWVADDLPTMAAQENETFSGLCERLDLDTKQARLYWQWLGKFYSPTVGARTDKTVCTQRMPCPWGRTQRSTLLSAGQVFPVPQGRLWNQLLKQRTLKDNGGNTEHESVRLSKAYLTAIVAHERHQDAITRATSDKEALREATLFMTNHTVHEQDDDKKGIQLRAMMAKLGGGSARLAPSFATLGLIASIAHGSTGDMSPFGYHPEATWVEHQKENDIRLDVNKDGMIQIYAKNTIDLTPPTRTITCRKAKKSVQDAAKRGEDPINPLTGRVRPPKSIKDIEGRPDEAQWRAAVQEEMASLESMGVFHHDLTIDQCREMGVTTSPVPLMITFDAKHTPLGTFDRAKARICVAGSPHWMKAGIHYGLTFAATPAHEITRILMALCVARGYARFQWDIKSAFMSTPIKPQDRIVLRYPKGAERFDDKGRTLYAVLDKVLYGVPSASRKFGQYLRKWILERFSEGGFSVKSSRSEPCLYMITNKAKRMVYLSIFTDDCQAVGPNINDLKEIGEIFASKFEIKICDSQELLGVRRVIKKEADGSTSMVMTQPGFLDSTCKEFAPQVEQVYGKKIINTPFPPREMLSRSEIPEDTAVAKREHAQYTKEGSMSMTGCILWAARNTMPELSYGVSQLCRMMSTPTEKSYNCALHMISYMSTQVDRGIRYNSKGNTQLIGHFDSSLKPDPVDSKCQWGYVFYWMNGPICWASKKHNHVSLSTTQAEYQALAHCARAAVWLRTMFKEMGLGEYVSEPTILLGDCINANMLAKEDKVTAQNRHILMSYHYAKEMVESGEICPRRVTTKLNSSDLLTKANPRPDLQRLVPVLTGHGGELPPIPDLPRD